MLHVMLSLDFSHAETERYDFYKHLQGLGWEKFGDVDTVWRREFPNRSTDSTSAMGTAGDISEELIEAAKKFQPKEISYVAQVGNHEAFARVVKKKFSQYSVYDS